MRKAIFTILAISILIAACAGNPAPTQTPDQARTPYPTYTAYPTYTPVPSPADDLSLTLTPGITLSLVSVPAGEFTMGSPDTDSDADPAERPQHTVYLDEYLIGKYDVTNAQYRIFVQATHRVWTMPAARESYPVVNVTWSDALAFCEWASQQTGRKVQLPSEAQWEKAARGKDGRKYPWGNEEPDANRLNFNDNARDITPVGQYSPQGDSPYGAADMAGNVFQWTSSLERPYPYRAGDGRENQGSRDWRVVRGGGYIVGSRGVRSASRATYDPISRYDDVGFRVVTLPK